MEELIKNKEIELRAEEVQEIMNKPPSWIQRWGIVLMFCIILILLIGSYLIKYPDTIEAEIIVTTSNPPVDIIARSSGKIDEIFVKNNSAIKKDCILSVIQNPAKTVDVLLLADRLGYWKNCDYDLKTADSLFSFSSLSLGNMQAGYSAFISNLKVLQNFIKQNYYSQKIGLLVEKNNEQKDYFDMIIRQKKLAEEQLQTSQKMFDRDSILYKKNIATGNEFDAARNSYIQSRLSYISHEISLKQSEMQLLAGKENLLDLKNQAMDIENNLHQALHNSTEQLNAEIKAWENSFLLRSPIDGFVNYMGVWSKNQNIATGETVFSILPAEKGYSKGKALLAAQGSGKVKTGQKVNVRISNFPDQQFGYLVGEITSISSTINKEGFYVLEISFPEGLKTNYNISLPGSQQLIGNAKIITEDVRVIERFIQPIKSIINSQKR